MTWRLSDGASGSFSGKVPFEVTLWTEVDVESLGGNEYTLRVETMRMPADYEFGVGQQYTLYIATGLAYGSTIIYASQQTSVAQPNSRGRSQPLDYSTNDWDDYRHPAKQRPC
jgi:hypothetical protein